MRLAPLASALLCCAAIGEDARVRPESVSGPLSEYNYSEGDDGRLAVFARSEADFARARIMVTRRAKGGWTTPVPIGFSDPRYRDSDPWLTPDGGTLYFVSDRPTPARPGKRDLDLWRSVRHGNDWSAPEHLGDAVNGAGEELGPELHGGVLYFATARRSGMGGLDIYAARLSPDGFAKPDLLPTPINSAASESDFTLSRDGRTAFFWRMTEGKGMIHRSRLGPQGWSTPAPLGPAINRGGFNFTPALAHDGRTLTFASDAARPGQANGLSDVYRVRLR